MMMQVKMSPVLATLGVVVLASAQCAEANSVRFYENTNLLGDSHSFDTGSLPRKGACGGCENLVGVVS